MMQNDMSLKTPFGTGKSMEKLGVTILSEFSANLQLRITREKLKQFLAITISMKQGSHGLVTTSKGNLKFVCFPLCAVCCHAKNKYCMSLQVLSNFL